MEMVEVAVMVITLLLLLVRMAACSLLAVTAFASPFESHGLLAGDDAVDAGGWLHSAKWEAVACSLWLYWLAADDTMAVCLLLVVGTGTSYGDSCVAEVVVGRHCCLFCSSFACCF